MSKTIVTLSGDDAELFRAFQRIIDQQSKTDAGYRKLAQSSRDAANAAKKSAKEAADAERDRQRQVDNMAGAVTGMVASYVSVQGAINLVTAAHSRMVERQGEALDLARQIAASQQEAAKNMAGQSPAQIDEALTQRVPEIAKATKFADLPKLTTALGSAASIVGPEAAPDVVRAAAQVTRFTPDELQKTTTATADLMAATGLKDAERALALLASTGSVARPEQLSKLATGAAVAANAAVTAAPNQAPVAAASEAIALYAKLSKVDPEGQSAATATVGIIKQIGDLFTDTKQARERADKIETLRGQAAAVPLAIERAAIDVEEKRQKAAPYKPDDQSIPARESRLELAKAETELADARKRAATVSRDLAHLEAVARVTGTTPEAQAAKVQLPLEFAAMRSLEDKLPAAVRQKVAAQSTLEGLQKRPGGADPEQLAKAQGEFNAADEALRTLAAGVEAAKAKIAELRAAAPDPGTFAGRLELVQKTPELRQQLTESLTGEAKFLPLMKQLLESGSQMANEFDSARRVVNTRPESFRAVASTTVQTDQARIVAAETGFNATRNIAQTFETDGQIRDAASKIAASAIVTTDRGAMDNLQSAFFTAQRGLDSMTATTPDYLVRVEQQLQQRLFDLGNRGADPKQIDVAKSAFDAVQELAKLPAVLDRFKSDAELKQFLADQATLQRKTNELLSRISDKLPDVSQRPAPAAIRANATNPPVERSW